MKGIGYPRMEIHVLLRIMGIGIFMKDMDLILGTNIQSYINVMIANAWTAKKTIWIASNAHQEQSFSKHTLTKPYTQKEEAED